MALLLNLAEIVQRQLHCKQRLESELNKEKKRLDDIKRELLAIEAQLPVGGAKTLSEEIEQLQINCSQMAKEVEEAGPSYSNIQLTISHAIYLSNLILFPFSFSFSFLILSHPGALVLGEINEAFYQNIYTGQRLPIQRGAAAARSHQPPPPIPAALRSNRPSGSATSPIPTTSSQPNPHYQIDEQLEASGSWTCKLCTFQNHPLLDKCEQCDLPLFSAGNTNADGSLPPNGFVANDQARVLQTGYVPMQYHQQQPNRIHIPFQKQAAVTVGTVRSPTVYAYATPP